MMKSVETIFSIGRVTDTMRQPYSDTIYSNSVMPNSWRKFGSAYRRTRLPDLELERLLILAAETGARFERQDVDCDPLTWLYAPMLFLGGRAPVVACQEPGAFELAMRFHDRGIGLDGLPEQFIGRGPGAHGALDYRPVAASAVAGRSAGVLAAGVTVRQKLFTSTIVDLDGLIERHIFHAAIANGASEINDALVLRFGLRLAGLARTREGFDPSDPIVLSLVSEAMTLTLEQLAMDASDKLGDGLEIVLESRFVG